MAKFDWQSLLIGESIGVLPNILQLIEVIHARQPGEPSNSVTKTGAATQLAQTALTIAAANGVIPQSDAQNIPAIMQLVIDTVKSMQNRGKLGGSKAPTTPAPLAVQSSTVTPTNFTPAPQAVVVDTVPTPSAPFPVSPLKPPVQLPVNLSSVVGRANPQPGAQG